MVCILRKTASIAEVWGFKKAMAAVFLENLTWVEAEKVLSAGAVIVIPLGAALKEHGKHLPLNNDKLMAEHLILEVAKRLDVIVLPTISSSFYPAFTEYPGSISHSLETSAALISETCSGLAAFGCKKIYVLNTGVSTLKVLAKVKETLSLQSPHVQFSYTDFKKAVEAAAAGLSTQAGGGHADEVETSIMLHLAPDVVKMENAAADFHGEKPGPLTRNSDLSNNSDAVYSPTGAWGDPTLASSQKGKTIVNRLVDWIEKDILQLH